MWTRPAQQHTGGTLDLWPQRGGIFTLNEMIRCKMLTFQIQFPDVEFRTVQSSDREAAERGRGPLQVITASISAETRPMSSKNSIDLKPMICIKCHCLSSKSLLYKMLL